MPEKIRPPSHSSLQPSPKNIREEGEEGLQDLVRAPDPNTRVQPGEDAISAQDGADAMAGWPARPPGAFTPVEAQELRRTMNDPNRRGNPRRNTSAEDLLLEYNASLAAYRAAYAGTRLEPADVKIRYLTAKQAMIDSGLMKGDV
jgi:hypothetical protein